MLLSRDETQHLKHVLRLKVDDACLITDGKGHEAEAVIESFLNDGTTRLKVIRLTKNDSERLSISLFVSVPHKDKMESIVQKAQELSVRRIIPLESDHSVVRIPAALTDKVLTRWRKIAAEASKQSGALTSLDILPPCKLKKTEAVYLQGADPCFSIFCHPGHSSLPLGQLLDERLRKIQNSEGGKSPSFNVFIGPEGGFSNSEYEWALKLGMAAAHLGPTLLKVDTAAIAVISYLKLFWLSKAEGYEKS